MVTSSALYSLRAPCRAQQPLVRRGASSSGPTRQRREACIAHVSSSTIGVGRNDKVELETLAREILNKENEIKNAFQPGKPMPKGSQVAAMRAKVKELRDTLAAKIQASSTSSDSISTNKEISSLITGVAAVQARESMNTMNAQMNSTKQQSNMMLEDGTLLSEEEVLELEMLQLENEQLRAKASALLMRQHFLEELMQENDLAVAVPQPKETAPAPDTNGSQNGYYMSSPSYY